MHVWFGTVFKGSEWAEFIFGSHSHLHHVVFGICHGVIVERAMRVLIVPHEKVCEFG